MSIIDDLISKGFRIVSYTINGDSIDTINVEKRGINILMTTSNNKVVAIFDYRDIHIESIIPNEDIVNHIDNMVNDIINKIQESSIMYSEISKTISKIDFKDFKVRVTIGDYVKISLKRESRLYGTDIEAIKEFIKETIDKLEGIYEAINR